jgi:hypothetical protein
MLLLFSPTSDPKLEEPENGSVDTAAAELVEKNAAVTSTDLTNDVVRGVEVGTLPLSSPAIVVNPAPPLPGRASQRLAASPRVASLARLSTGHRSDMSRSGWIFCFIRC